MTPETSGDRPALTIAVIAHRVRGYPANCLGALGADRPAPGIEYLWVEGPEAPANPDGFPGVRRVTISDGDRAAAKNRALSEAQGELVLLMTADIQAAPGAVEALRRAARSRDGGAAVSAQLLLENGLVRRTDFGFPSAARELNPLRWIASFVRGFQRRGTQPSASGVRPARSLHAACLMATREVFDKVGPFTEGYRFALEDIEWSDRAHAAGVPLLIAHEAHAFKLAPQRRGALEPAASVELERSLRRLVRRRRSGVAAGAYVAARVGKHLAVWLASALVDTVFCGAWRSVRHERRCRRALLWMRQSEPVPPEAESHVRWESSC